MVAAEARLTVEQFLAMPEIEGIKRELIDGELFEMAYGGPPHETVKGNAAIELGAYIKMGGRRVRFCLETRFYPGEFQNPEPDLAVVLSGVLDPTHSGKITAVPDLVLEVASSEPVGHLQRKIRLYRRVGVRAIIVTYPDSSTVDLYFDGVFRHLEFGDTLELPDLLPGFAFTAVGPVCGRGSVSGCDPTGTGRWRGRRKARRRMRRGS